MTTQKKLFIYVSLCISLILSSTAFTAHPRTDLLAGTIYVDGYFRFNYTQSDFSNPIAQSLSLTSQVGGGYFIVDNWSLGISLPAEWQFFDNGLGSLGLSLNSSYYFDVGLRLYPYIGISAIPGYSFRMKAAELRAALQGGVIISLSESIAVDFGLSPEIYFPISDQQHWMISIPFGFMGIRAFF
jgi:hypothetical protein